MSISWVHQAKSVPYNRIGKHFDLIFWCAPANFPKHAIEKLFKRQSTEGINFEYIIQLYTKVEALPEHRLGSTNAVERQFRTQCLPSSVLPRMFLFIRWQWLISFHIYASWFILPSVLWRCWLGDRKDIRPVKNWVVGCWCGCLSGARCRLAYGPADATATHCLLLH